MANKDSDFIDIASRGPMLVKLLVMKAIEFGTEVSPKPAQYRLIVRRKFDGNLLRILLIDAQLDSRQSYLITLVRQSRIRGLALGQRWAVRVISFVGFVRGELASNSGWRCWIQFLVKIVD